MGILSDEMDEAYTATDNLGVIIGASRGPAVDLAGAIDQMTMDIEEAQAAADLNQAAFDALSPAMMTAAMELGIFRGAVEAVGSTAATIGDNLTRLGIGGGSRIDDPGGVGYDRVRGRGGSKGGLNSEEIRRRLERSQNGAILDPYSGTIYTAGGGRLTRSGGNLRGRDLRDYRETYQNALNQYDLPGAIAMLAESMDTTTTAAMEAAPIGGSSGGRNPNPR